MDQNKSLSHQDQNPTELMRMNFKGIWLIPIYSTCKYMVTLLFIKPMTDNEHQFHIFIYFFSNCEVYFLEICRKAEVARHNEKMGGKKKQEG